MALTAPIAEIALKTFTPIVRAEPHHVNLNAAMNLLNLVPVNDGCSPTRNACGEEGSGRDLRGEGSLLIKVHSMAR